MSHPTLKQFGDLALRDFDVSPVWVQCHVTDYEEPWYEKTDEETFRPWDQGTPVDPESGLTFLVRATFELAAAAMPMPGFVSPQPRGEVDLGFMQPQIFVDQARFGGFWLGMFLEPDTSFYRSLLDVSDPVFPINFSALPNLAVGLASGVLEGFYRWTEDGGVLVPSPT